jgi:pimeloyl-ACP methyl ester carboxylesterase
MEDVAAFVREFRIYKPLVYGFSDGGVVGLMLAAKYPDLLSGLIASGVNLTPKDLKLRFRAMVRTQHIFKRDPMIKLMLDEPNITDEDLQKIKIPVLITVAEKDIISVSHAETVAKKISAGSLLIVPKEDHGSYIIHSEKLFPLISDFVEKTS